MAITQGVFRKLFFAFSILMPFVLLINFLSLNPLSIKVAEEISPPGSYISENIYLDKKVKPVIMNHSGKFKIDKLLKSTSFPDDWLTKADAYESLWRSQMGVVHNNPRNKRLIDTSSFLVKVEDEEEEIEMDVVVPFFLTTLMTKDRILAYNKYLIPKPRNIIFMAETAFSCELLQTFADNVHCIPMSSLSSWSIPEIKYVYTNISITGRHGWFVQQFGKLFSSLPDIGLSENFLIIDSDNLLLKPFEVMRKVKTIDGKTYPNIQSKFYNMDLVSKSIKSNKKKTIEYNMKVSSVKATYKGSNFTTLQYLFYAGNNSKMWFRDYGPTTGDLLGYYPFITLPITKTMVPHWMVFNKKYIKTMLREISFHLFLNNMPDLYTCIFTRSELFIDKQKASSLSEYELYSSWMVRNHPEQINFDPYSAYKSDRNPPHRKSVAIDPNFKGLDGKCFLDEEDIEYLSIKLDYVTWEEEKLLRNNGCHDVNQSSQIEIDHRKQERDIVFNYEKDLSKLPRLHLSVWYDNTSMNHHGNNNNQYLKALLKTLQTLGVVIVENEITLNTNVILLNSHTFNHDEFYKVYKELHWERRSKIIIVHRLDRPPHGHIRLMEKNMKMKLNVTNIDKDLFMINGMWANMTVHHSLHSWMAWNRINKPFEFKRRVLIRNAPDPYIFKPIGASIKKKKKLHKPIRIASTAWSNGWIEGEEKSVQYLINHLDPNEFEVCFMGNAQITPKHGVRFYPSGGPEEVASFLAQTDIFIASSQEKLSTSDSLIEAVTMGLPVLFLDEGDRPEEVGFGGVSFSKNEEIIPALRDIVDNYETFLSLVGMPLHRDIYELAAHYIDVFRGREPGSMLEP